MNNFYEDEELNENPPEIHDYKLIKRSLLSDKPRIIKFDIDWTGNSEKSKNNGLGNFMFNESNQLAQSSFN